MIVVETAAALRALSKPDSARVFVPTMGALHAGHASLIDEAHKHGDQVVVSIFVNPTQFAPTEDLSQYPRTLQADLETCEKHGVDVVFVPDTTEVYPPGAQTSVVVGGVTEQYEGLVRPTHFVGVATVVAALFHLVSPNVAVFGQKDLQQCATIAKMVHELHFPIEIVISPTIREDSGLAMSSRNRYLSTQDRHSARIVYQVLCSCNNELTMTSDVDSALSHARLELVNAGFELDYFDLISFKSFAPTRELLSDAYLIVAGRWHGVRLIDNLKVQ